MIHLHNVYKTYPPDQNALKGLDLDVKAGDFIFIAGASGAGKSTLLKLLFGAETPSKGEVVIGGRNLSSIDRDGIAHLRREIGVIFQDYKLLPRRTVADNVAFGLEVLGIKESERKRLALSLLKSIGLEDRGDALPLTLSGGEQQRVSIARALIHQPRLILADEPTGNLDPDMTRVVFDLLLEANAAGVTVLVATHNLAIIEELNLRTVVLDRGKIIGDFQSPRGIA
ncbi:MAG: cell division ATP-binding protein FtsE [Deltaproteobacteria bacterium]|nr:cell division ATP-binding protein FtsE [Deltaproteobacteria bacterium]